MRVKCEDISLIDMKFTKKADREPGKHDIPVCLEPEYAMSSEPNDKAAKLMIRFKVGEPENESLPFYFSLKLAGIFSWDDLTEKEAEKEIISEGAELLLSFARTSLYDIMGKAGLKQIILPIEHFGKDDIFSDEL
ncbi:protein-export chaperone SecB [Lachnospiraceae bacterium KK002]